MGLINDFKYEATEVRRTGGANPNPDWLVPGVLNRGVWLVGGNASDEDKMRVLNELAISLSRGTVIFGNTAPAQDVTVLTYGQSIAGFTANVQRSGQSKLLETVQVASSRDPDFQGPSELIEKELPNGGVLIIDGFELGPIFTRKEVERWYEMMLPRGGAVSFIVRLPQFMSTKSALLTCSWSHDGVIEVDEWKGQILVKISGRDVSIRRFAPVNGKWIELFGATKVSPAQAAVIAVLVESPVAMTASAIWEKLMPQDAKIDNTFHHMLDRMAQEPGAVISKVTKGTYSAKKTDFVAEEVEASDKPPHPDATLANETPVSGLGPALKPKADA